MRLLVVDDDPVFRDELAELLAGDGHATETAASVQKAEQALEAREFDVVLTDLKMPRQSGMELLHRVRARWPRTLVVMVTGFASVDTALEAMKGGAFDYLRKPFRIDQVRTVLQLAAQERSFEAPEGVERDPIREATTLATEGGYPVLLLGEAPRRPVPQLTVHPLTTLGPSDLIGLVDGFLADRPRAAVVISSVDGWLAEHRLEDVVAALDQVRGRMSGRGPLRVGFSAMGVPPAAASALGQAVATSETHATLEAMANPIRRKILQRLGEGAAGFTEALRAAELDDSPKMSFHLRRLSDAGLVRHEDETYRLTPRGEAAVRLLGAAAFLPPAESGGNLAFPRSDAPDRRHASP